MEQYIPKSVVLAEIENWKQHTLKCGYAGQGEYEEGNMQGRLDTCEKFLSFLDTVKVKEVDLNEYINKYFKGWYVDLTDQGNILHTPDGNAGLMSVKEVAKHFFELGIKTQHSSINIPNIDNIFEKEGIDPNSKDAKILKECYYMALEKLKVQKEE